MYKIFADSTLIYDSTLEDYKIGKGEITLEIGKAGSFVFSMFPDHPFYDRLVKMKTIITVYRGNEIIFRGRPLDYKDDFHNNRVVTCEGALNFFHDSIIRPYSFQGTPAKLFREFIEEHNAQVDESKRFIIGEITVVDENDYISRSNSAYEDTLSNIEGHLIGDTLGGQLFITYNEDGKTVINYYADFAKTAAQSIEFGENLKDYTRTSNAEGIVTVLIPLGAKLKDSENRLTIVPINDGRDYIENADAIAIYGRIVGTFVWDNVTVINNLLRKGEEKLIELSTQNTTIELTALDLHLLDRSIESYGYGMYIPVISKPHGLDVSMLCQKQTINLLNPGNDTLVLGYTLSSLTDSGKKTSSSVKKVQQNVNETVEKINQLPDTYVLVNQLSAKIQSYIDSDIGKAGIISALEGTYLTVNELEGYAKMTDVSASIAQAIDEHDATITLEASKSTYDVENVKYQKSTITLKSGSTTIASADIVFQGGVTFEDLSTAGKTVINGANITTGTISAERIAADVVTTDRILLSGGVEINASNITTGTMDFDRINVDTVYLDRLYFNHDRDVYIDYDPEQNNLRLWRYVIDADGVGKWSHSYL